jgi:pimeloyl-ACP methyl ester carboxylesterase
MGGDSTVWDRVQPGVARFTRVCSYDRAGEGRSDPGPAAGTLQQTVNELHRLLLAAKVPKPYVLVGASWGGPIARVYASQHPELVAGMVLVDSTHEDAVLGFRGKMVSPRSLPAEEGGAFKADLDLLHASRGGQAQPLGDMPLMVLAAGQSGDPPPGIPAGEWQRLYLQKREQRADQARLSRNSKLVIAERSGHQIQRDDPELVICAIREVVQAARTGSRLAGAGPSER